MSDLYDKGRERFATAQIDWENDPISMVLVYDTYTFSAAHEYLVSIPQAQRASSLVSLTGKTATDGYCASDDTVFEGLTLTSDVTSAVIFYDSGDSATSFLIAYIDNAPEFPLTEDGDFTVIMDAGFGGWFRP